MLSWFTAQNLLLAALVWLVAEGVIGFARYRRSDRKGWAWWLLANSLSAVFLVIAALSLLAGKGDTLFAICMMGAFVAHLVEWKLRPDNPRH